MDNIPHDELELEQSAAQQFNKDEVRASIIAEFGFDEVTDGDKVDRLVQKAEEGHQRLSKAIGQKIKWRNEASKPKEPVTPPPPPETKSFSPEDVEKTVDARLQQRDLDEMEYPDEIKTEIKRIAQITQVSIKAAARDPYIASKISDYKKTQDADDGAITRKNRSHSSKEYSIDNPPELDMSSPEAFKKSNEEYDKWFSDMKKKGY
jgi:hypothetical protein